MSETEETYQDEAQEGDAEAVAVMEKAKKRKEEKMAEELAEFAESRKEEKAKEEDAIRSLKEKREQRLKERAEDEKRWAEQRAQEEARRKAEEEERRRKKQEEEDKKKAERDRKRREAEKRMMPKKPNFKIVKRDDGTEVEERIEKEDDDKPKQKSKEELEKEKRAVLEQRIKPLGIDGADKAKLVERANELHAHLLQLAGNQYDLEQAFKRQQYDMIELAERARQMSKTKSRRGVSSVQIDESFDRLADKFTSAPPKIRLCSKYERHTDSRSYDQRKQMYEELSIPPSPPQIKRIYQAPQESEEREEDAE